MAMITLCPRCERVFAETFDLEEIPDGKVKAASCGYCFKRTPILTRYRVTPKGRKNEGTV